MLLSVITKHNTQRSTDMPCVALQYIQSWCLLCIVAACMEEQHSTTSLHGKFLLMPTYCKIKGAPVPRAPVVPMIIYYMHSSLNHKTSLWTSLCTDFKYHWVHLVSWLNIIISWWVSFPDYSIPFQCHTHNGYTNCSFNSQMFVKIWMHTRASSKVENSLNIWL